MPDRNGLWYVGVSFEVLVATAAQKLKILLTTQIPVKNIIFNLVKETVSKEFDQPKSASKIAWIRR